MKLRAEAVKHVCAPPVKECASQHLVSSFCHKYSNLNLLVTYGLRWVLIYNIFHMGHCCKAASTCRELPASLKPLESSLNTTEAESTAPEVA